MLVPPKRHFSKLRTVGLGFTVEHVSRSALVEEYLESIFPVLLCLKECHPTQLRWFGPGFTPKKSIGATCLWCQALKFRENTWSWIGVGVEIVLLFEFTHRCKNNWIYLWKRTFTGESIVSCACVLPMVSCFCTRKAWPPCCRDCAACGLKLPLGSVWWHFLFNAYHAVAKLKKLMNLICLCTKSLQPEYIIY